LEALESETKYFLSHPSYKKMATQMGIKALSL